MVPNITLRFRGGKSLTRKVDFILTFDKHSMGGMYQHYNGVATRVTGFPAGGGGAFQFTYTADHAFTRAQMSGSVVEVASFHTRIQPKEKTTLKVLDPNPPRTYEFTKPEVWAAGEPGQYLCYNATGAYQNIGVGFYEEGKKIPTTALVLNTVPGASAVAAEFTPILSAYVATGYKSNEVLKAQIQGSLKWSLDLTKPDIHLYWVLQESGAGFVLNEDSPF